MNALILAGGRGTRLMPLTATKPKPMVRIQGKPLLWYHIKHLRKHNIRDICIATGPFGEIIRNYFKDGSKYKVKITYSAETSPLGTAGAIRNPNSSFTSLVVKSNFLVVYGDNLTDYDYTKLINFHKSRKAIATIGLYQSPEPWTQGLVHTDKRGRVLKFTEKPPKDEIETNLAFAGVIVCSPDILEYIPEGKSDFGFDIFPKILKLGLPLYAKNTNSYVQDIGSIPRLKKARRDLKSGLVKSLLFSTK